MSAGVPACAGKANKRRRKSILVLATSARTGESTVQALADSLESLGVQTTSLGREESAKRIAAAVADEGADAVELCLSRHGGGVVLLRGLLRELADIGRRDVSIVVHKVE
jgi:methylmalonyl-CoA mutase cobalamin-binding subunit